MAGYHTGSTFFDASGKHRDHKIVVFAGVAAYNEFFNPFGNEWGRLLYKNGLQLLTAKDAFNARRPLSRKNSRVGINERVEDLLPFIRCVRTHIQVVTGVAVDVRVFRKMPSHFFQTYAHDPVFLSFARALLRVVDFTPDKDKIVFTCDDDEEIAIPMFRLYRRIKKVWPDARNKLVAISFADDRHLFALQAADLVAGLVRLEAGRALLRVKYDYRRLYEELVKNPDGKTEKLWEVSFAMAGKKSLPRIAADLEAQRKEMLKNEQAGRRI